MSLEPVQSSPCALESKGSAGRICMLPFCGVVAQHAQAAVLGMASCRPRVKLWVSGNNIARANMLWSSQVPELRVCHVIDEFHRL